MTEAAVPPLEVDVNATQGLLKTGQIVLIDCRERSEYEVACIDNSVLMPMSEWNSVAEQLEQFVGRKLVVHCHHGMRSLNVARWLRENGFPDAQSMAGGIAAWSAEIDPSVPNY